MSPLSGITEAFLAPVYRLPTAVAIQNHIRDFLPFESNLPPFQIRFAPDAMGVSTLQMELSLQGGGENGSRSGRGNVGGDVRLQISYPHNFPYEMLRVRVLPPTTPGMQIKTPYPVMDVDGTVRVDCLSMLRGAAQPFPLLDVILALKEQFDLESPYISINAAQDLARQQQLQSTNSGVMANVLYNSTQDAKRASLIQEVAEKVVIDVNNKATSYLETREQSLFYLHRLNEENRELTKAKDVLSKHKQELESYLPKSGNVSVLMRTLEGIPNTIEERSRCLVTEKEAEEKVLQLTAQVYACQDALALLETGLKNEDFTVDEYVKCVSDVAREEFIARFQCLRALKECGAISDNVKPPSGPSSPGGNPPASPPAIPQRPSPEEVLVREFPQASREVIADVLQNVGTKNVVAARAQLKELYGN